MYLHQAIQELAPLQQRLDADVLVEPMDAARVRTCEKRLNSISGDAGGIRVNAIRSPVLQDWQHWNAWPRFGRQFLCWAENRVRQRRCRSGRWKRRQDGGKPDGGSRCAKPAALITRP